MSVKGMLSEETFELSRLYTENEYLEETLWDDVISQSIGTLSKECINCVAFSFLMEHGRTKYNLCRNDKVKLASINYPKAL